MCICTLVNLQCLSFVVYVLKIKVEINSVEQCSIFILDKVSVHIHCIAKCWQSRSRDCYPQNSLRHLMQKLMIKEI